MTDMKSFEPVSLLASGVYSFADASLYTGLRSARVREWFSDSKRPRVFLSDYDDLTDQRLISFNDLIEVFIAGQMRERGASLRTIRESHRVLSAQWNVKHPFCRQELAVHQGKILYASLTGSQKDEVYDVLTKQRAFPDVIRPFLKQLRYDQATASATLWYLANGVELDPRICFGKPIVSKSKKPTYLIAAAYNANGRNEDVTARWYGITTDDVRAAVAFESSLSA